MNYSCVRASLNCEKGVSILELALILPVLILIIIAFIEFGWTLRDLQIIANAAREGARVAADHSRLIEPPPPLPGNLNRLRDCANSNLPLSSVNCAVQTQLTIDYRDPIDIAAKKATCLYIHNTSISPADWNIQANVRVVSEDGSDFKLVRVSIDKRPEARRCLLCWDRFVNFISYHRESTFALEGDCRL